MKIATSRPPEAIVIHANGALITRATLDCFDDYSQGRQEVENLWTNLFAINKL
jgi:hypothetical protein